MLTNEYFTKDEIIETMQDAEDYSVNDFDELFNSMFNSDYYIIGRYEAAKALETYKNDEEVDGYKTAFDGVFGAIGLIEQYESDQFGQVSTPLGDPEQVANMVEYIQGETLFTKALNEAGLDIDSEATGQNIQKFIEATKKL